MATIHATAVVDPKAELAGDVVIGPYAIVEENVVIGEGTEVGPHALVAYGSRIGKRCKIHKGAVVGTIPQDLKFAGEETTLEVGDGTVIREFCTLNRGTSDRWKTEVGSNCLLMAYVHVAHDCVIGNNVILANAVNMAGHVVIGDYVGIGGMVPIHQFVRIGRHAFVGGGYRVPKDVPPFILVAGEPLKFAGINRVGLRRRGFSSETIDLLRRVYKLIYRSDLNVSQAITRIKEEFPLEGVVKEVVDFIESSERGIVK